MRERSRDGTARRAGARSIMLVGALLLIAGGAAASTRTPAATRVSSSSTSVTRDYSVDVGGRQRTFIVVAPHPLPSRAMPLVLVFHGAEDTASATERETDLNKVAAAKGVLVAYLQGYDDTWNEGAGHTPAEQAGVNDVAFTASALAVIGSHYRFEHSAVAATGISNGALMVEDLGCHLAKDLTVIVPVEGELPVSVAKTCAPSRPVAVLEVHGTADSAIPYGGGPFAGVGGGTTVLSAPSSVARWASLDRCRHKLARTSSGSSVTTGYTSCAAGVTVRLDTIEGGGHSWPNDFGQLVVSAVVGAKS